LSTGASAARRTGENYMGRSEVCQMGLGLPTEIVGPAGAQ